MNSLVNRVTTIINQQNALLEATLAAEARAEGLPTNGASAAPAAGATPSEIAETAVNDPSNALQLELSNWSSRVKIMVPIIVLILLKILADHFITGFVVILCVTSFYRLKSAFELELALKDRSSSLNILGLLLGSTGLLCAIIVEIRLLNYNDAIGDRLQFHLTASQFDKNSSLLSILWVCIVTDGVVQLMVLVCKIFVVNVIGLYYRAQGSSFKCKTGRSIWRNGLQFESLRQNDSADLESGTGSTTRTAASTLAATISSFGLSSLGSRIGQLVRRQTTTLSANISREERVHQQQQPQQPRNEAGVSSTESAAAIDGTQDGQNSSDASVTSHESTDFLLKVRVCGLIDMLGLVYRTALPMPLWAFYFYFCPTIGFVLRVLYVAVKFYDISWKARGAAEAFMLFVTRKIEFGHYSTEEDLRGREDGACECPVCFDNPHHPVTLDCHHIFCEVCILEWLEKEPTCPVCRAKVERSSPQVQAVKCEAVYTFPIFV